jgi:hypothetical protein
VRLGDVTIKSDSERHSFEVQRLHRSRRTVFQWCGYSAGGLSNTVAASMTKAVNAP